MLLPWHTASKYPAVEPHAKKLSGFLDYSFSCTSVSMLLETHLGQSCSGGRFDEHAFKYFRQSASPCYRTLHSYFEGGMFGAAAMAHSK